MESANDTPRLDRPPAASPSPTAPASAGEVGPAGAMPVCEFNGVSMAWGERLVLDQVALRVQAGERLVVVGPSGSGKSTILRLMAGLLLPSRGVVKLHGVVQRYLRLDQRHPPDVRLVFQNPALLASLTVRENVGFLLYRRSRLAEREIRERVSRALKAVGLEGTEERLPGELSGGMQKRVSFARALIEDPTEARDQVPLLLFDEPTAGLDPVACTRIEDLIVQTTGLTHASGVVVSHVHSTIERCADRVILLYGGQFRWSGTAEQYRECTDPYVVQFRTGSLNGPIQPAEH
jgi:phospholipid/cholesterol/gamma-HCH transport system ATP-binding protein